MLHTAASSLSPQHLRYSEVEWQSVSDVAKDLIANMLHPLPERRPKCDEILQHTWMQKNVASDTPLPFVLNGLRKFKMDGLQKLVLRLMSTMVENEEVVNESKRLFAELDVQRKGVVQKGDLAGLLRTQKVKA